LTGGGGTATIVPLETEQNVPLKGATMSELADGTCETLPAGTPPLSAEECAELLGQLHGWKITGEGKLLQRRFAFNDYYGTLAFVNAVAWIAHQQDHHPDMEVGYNTCTVRYSTHSIGGLSRNDFICAARVDSL
jgi:4a-hydroxytetrahydrobiopterin dehydratase